MTTQTTASAVHVPRGWAALVALGPITGRTDALCRICGESAVTALLKEWRCANHPPQPGEWGAHLDWAPRTGGSCAPRRCYCARCPGFALDGGSQPLSDSALLDERAIATGKRRVHPQTYRAARDNELARRRAQRTSRR